MSQDKPQKPVQQIKTTDVKQVRGRVRTGVRAGSDAVNEKV